MEQLRFPDGQLTVQFDIADDGDNRDIYRQCPLWSVAYRSRTMLLPSRLGLELDGQPSLLTHFAATSTSRGGNDATWKPECGEYSEVRDHDNDLEISVQEPIRPHRELLLTFRAYDTGAAFQYAVPDYGDGKDAAIWREATRFDFPAGCEG